MLNTISTTSQTVAVDGVIDLGSVDIQSGTTSTYLSNTSTISLNKSGTYLITFSATAAATEAATNPIIVQMYNGSDEVSGATQTASSTAATSYVSLNFSKVIRVLPSCCAVNNKGAITFENTGIAATYTNVNVVVIKLS